MNAGPTGIDAGAPKNGTSIPPPLISRSPTIPMCSPRLIAADSSRRARRKSTIRTPNAERRPLDPFLERRVAKRLHRRDDPLSGAVREVQAEQLDRAEVAAEEDDRHAAGKRRVDVDRVLDVDARVEHRGVESGGAKDLEVVVGVVPERRADECLERSRITCGGTRPRTRQVVVGEVPDDTPEIAAGLARPLRREAVRERADPLRDGHERSLREAARQPRHAEQEASADTLAGGGAFAWPGRLGPPTLTLPDAVGLPWIDLGGPRVGVSHASAVLR